MQRVGRRGANHDGGSVLIIVKDGDVHPLAADLFNDETIGRFDVFKIDGAKAWLHRADDLGQLFWVRFV